MSEMIDLPEVRMHYHDTAAGDEVVLLLHGWPQTSHCWRHVIPLLRDHRRCIAPDLRGYGLTSKPVGDYTKRTMAQDLIDLLDALEIERVHLVGHDRGGRVAHRMALDHLDRVATLSVLDISPTHAMFTKSTMRTSLSYFHWLFHMQSDLPELLAGRDIEGYLRYFFERWTFRRDQMEEAIGHYVWAFTQPGALRAGFDDYRATPADVELDEIDRQAGNLVEAPTLALWGARGLASDTSVLENWQDYCRQVEGTAIEECGHFVPEEQPEIVADELTSFWAR